AVFQVTLLDGHLGGGLQMLHDAAAADAEVRTGRLDALAAGLQDVLQFPDLVAAAPCRVRHAHSFAGQGAVHEMRAAVLLRNAAPFHIQGFDIQFHHVLPALLGRPVCQADIVKAKPAQTGAGWRGAGMASNRPSGAYTVATGSASCAPWRRTISAMRSRMSSFTFMNSL